MRISDWSSDVCSSDLFKKLAALTKLDSNANIDSVVSASTNLPMTYWYKNIWITSTKNIDDQSTDFRTAFDKMDDEIPDPGDGNDENHPQKEIGRAHV